MKTVLVLVAGVLGVSVSGIKICGTFCGPTYCDGKDPECAEVLFSKPFSTPSG
jgi:hypothetical protein